MSQSLFVAASVRPALSSSKHNVSGELVFSSVVVVWEDVPAWFSLCSASVVVSNGRRSNARTLPDTMYTRHKLNSCLNCGNQRDGNKGINDQILVDLRKDKKTPYFILHLWSRNVSSFGSYFNGSILVHLPVGFLPSRSSPLVKHHGFLYSNYPVILWIDITRRACCLPVTRGSGTIWSPTSNFSFLSSCKEKPLFSVPMA